MTCTISSWCPVRNDETIDMYLNRNTRLYAQLRWDDTWPGAARNVDLHLWRPDTKTWVAESEDIQNGGPADIPLEILKFTPDHADNKQYGLVIALHEGSAPAWLHLTVWGTEFFDILGWSQATRELQHRQSRGKQQRRAVGRRRGGPVEHK